MQFVKMNQIKISHVVILALMAAAMFLMPANTSVSQASSEPARKVYLQHYNEFGISNGFFHLIDEDLKWELTKAILSAGGLPTEENIDRLLHGR